jgi:hypothetical protein
MGDIASRRAVISGTIEGNFGGYVALGRDEEEEENEEERPKKHSQIRTKRKKGTYDDDDDDEGGPPDKNIKLAFGGTKKERSITLTSWF